MSGVTFPIFWALWVSHDLSSAARLAHIISPAGPQAALAQTSLLGKQGLHCPELDFFPLLHVCLILLWSHWCKRNELGLEWAVNASAMGITIYSINTECWWSPELWLSPSLGKPRLPHCLCLPAPSLPSDLQPFTKHRLGAGLWYLSGTATELVSKHKGLLFQWVNAAALLNYSKERDELGREPQSDQHF